MSFATSLRDWVNPCSTNSKRSWPMRCCPSLLLRPLKLGLGSVVLKCPEVSTMMPSIAGPMVASAPRRTGVAVYKEASPTVNLFTSGELYPLYQFRNLTDCTCKASASNPQQQSPNLRRRRSTMAPPEPWLLVEDTILALFRVLSPSWRQWRRSSSWISSCSKKLARLPRVVSHPSRPFLQRWSCQRGSNGEYEKRVY